VGNGVLRPRIPQDFPKPVKEMILDCLKQDPNGRPTAEQLLQSLEKFNTDIVLKQEEWFKLAEILL